MNDENNYKVIIIGDVGAGKTSLLKKFIDNDFDVSYNPTIGMEIESKIINIDDKEIKLEIWDTVKLIRLDKKNLNLY